MITREQAADISVFTQHCEIAFAHATEGPMTGDIFYSVTVEIGRPDQQSKLHGGTATFGTKVFSQDEVSQLIVRLWTELVLAGEIGNTGNPANPIQGITLTGNPLGNIIQISRALAEREHNTLQ